jgi:hypothetical protein
MPAEVIYHLPRRGKLLQIKRHSSRVGNNVDASAAITKTKALMRESWAIETRSEK